MWLPPGASWMRGRRTYPQLFHDLAVAAFDALLKAACMFMTEAGLAPPRHYRALGRSAFIQAARSVDTRLDRISEADVHGDRNARTGECRCGAKARSAVLDLFADSLDP